jgi:hypothetical protein
MTNEWVPGAGWAWDPTKRHAWRYWDGSAWTSRVCDAGSEATDAAVVFGHPEWTTQNTGPDGRVLPTGTADNYPVDLSSSAQPVANGLLFRIEQDHVAAVGLTLLGFLLLAETGVDSTYHLSVCGPSHRRVRLTGKGKTWTECHDLGDEAVQEANQMPLNSWC